MIRKKVLIYGCAVALTGFIASITMSRIYPSDIVVIGGLIAQTGGFIILFIGIWVYKTNRIVKSLNTKKVITYRC
jgi:succinate-acetate transporter protein